MELNKQITIMKSMNDIMKNIDIDEKKIKKLLLLKNPHYEIRIKLHDTVLQSNKLSLKCLRKYLDNSITNEFRNMILQEQIALVIERMDIIETLASLSAINDGFYLELCNKSKNDYESFNRILNDE